MNWNRIPSLSALRAFEAAARWQSFTKAADALNVTQAAIAQHVRSLEQDLAEALVTRRGRGIEITPKGRQLAGYLSEGFSLIEDGVEAVRAQSEARPVRLTTSPGFATHWLMPRMGDFWTSHPEVEISITPTVDVVDLRRDGFDLGIRYGEGNWPGVDAELLTDGDFWVVAPPEMVHGRTADCLADVQHLPWILEAQMRERRSLVEREGVDLDAVSLKLMTTNTLVMAAVKAGLGISIQSRSIVEDDVRKGELTCICALRHEDFGYYMVTVPGRDLPGLRAFTSWLRRQVREADRAYAVWAGKRE